MALENLMDFGLTEEQKQVRRSVRAFAEKEIAPYVAQMEREERYPLEIVKKMAELGYLGVMTPEKYGGAGLDHLSYGLICEELARVDWVPASVVSVQNSLVNTAILNFGTEEQREKYLRPLAKGQYQSSACLTEPSGGTDLASIYTTARRDGNKYILNGSKIFISHAAHAHILYVIATIDRALKHKGVCVFIVEKNTPGITIRPVPMHTLKRDNIAEVIFEDVEVPASNLLGQEGGGFKILGASLDTGRFSVACRCIGQAQACIDASLKYAMERTQFGQEIGKFQQIQAMIADMLSKTEAARLLVYQLGRIKDAGIKRASMTASMAKLLASEVCFECASNAVQIHGGYGLAEEFPVGRYLLESKVLHLGEGTSQLHRILIAEYALGIRDY
jgi:alkylation response protein AidB-like acyl-CoA dehydrogenase